MARSYKKRSQGGDENKHDSGLKACCEVGAGVSETEKYCGGNGGGLFNPPSDDEEPADLRFVAVTLDAPASVSTDDFLIGDGLPVRGPGINFDDN